MTKRFLVPADLPADTKVDGGTPWHSKNFDPNSKLSGLAVGTVTTGAPGTEVAVSITGTAPAQVLNFTIPRGDTGAPGNAFAFEIVDGDLFLTYQGNEAPVDMRINDAGELEWII